MADAVAFVLGSPTRRAVLGLLAEGAAEGPGVVRSADASKSAVYDALGRLADRSLIEETDEGRWRLTGAGRLVADTLERADRLERVLEADSTYWATHDVTGLPEEFRRSLDGIGDCEVVRSPDTDPYRAARRVESAIREARSVSIVAPVYSDRHAAALLETDASQRRLIMTPAMVRRLLRDEPAGPDADLDGLAIRIQPASLSLTVTDRELLFSLPAADGSFDAETEVVAVGCDAIEWGRRVFEHFWEQGTAIERWIAREHPDALPEVLERPGDTTTTPGAPVSNDTASVDGPEDSDPTAVEPEEGPPGGTAGEGE